MASLRISASDRFGERFDSLRLYNQGFREGLYSAGPHAAACLHDQKALHVPIKKQKGKTGPGRYQPPSPREPDGPHPSPWCR
eukprot:1159235-Pelagomonas_calceolata.AAC.6